MTRSGPIKVSLDGRGALVLRETDYVTSGGEGAIYRTGQTIVKLYNDPAKMSRDGMPDKIKMLARLQHAGIVAPQGLTFDEKRKPIGFYMPFVEGDPLSRVIVSDYRTRTGFDDADARTLAHAMYDVVSYAHSKKALLVDANELNWLVNFTKGSAPQAIVIDVDSWAIGRWPATVIMPSIRDWQAKDFGDDTDWFAWGIVSFQVFTGIHPFKGRMDGYKPGDMIQRMKDNASVFAAGVRLPHSVREFSCIPGPLLDWYQATFQQGARGQPPSPLDTAKPAVAARVLRAITTATGGLVFEKLFDRAGDPAIRIWANGAVLLASGEVADIATGKKINNHVESDAEVVRLENGNWFIAETRFGDPYYTVRVPDGAQLGQTISLATRRFFRMGERLFAVTDREMVELEVRDLGRPVITTGKRWMIRVKSTTWLEDIAVQDIFGSAFLIIPVGTDGVVQLRVPELDGANIVAGKAGIRFAAFTVLARDGSYRKVELTFDKTITGYKAWSGPADSADLNMGILPRGVVGTIVNDGELAIVVPSTGAVNKIADRGITTALKLASWGEKLVYIADGAVWQLRVAP